MDGVRPTISSAALYGSNGGSDGVYIAGEELKAYAWFNEDVIATGTPQMELDFEGTAKVADFDYAVPKCEAPTCLFSPGPFAVRGIRLVFTYTVLSDDSDSDGVAISANAVTLNEGAIKDAAGNDAVLTHDAVAENSNFVVDGDHDVGGL